VRRNESFLSTFLLPPCANVRAGGGNVLSFFSDFSKKGLDEVAYMSDNYNRFVGNKSVANAVVGISNRYKEL